MILPEIPHTSPSFIMAYQIDEKLCDMIVENFEDVKKLTQYDKIRGYHRLPESKLDSDILENYTDAIKSAFEAYKKEYEWSDIMTVPWSFFPPFNIQRYDPGDAYNPTHIEEGGPRKGKIQRKLAFTTYLNDIKKVEKQNLFYKVLKLNLKKV